MYDFRFHNTGLWVNCNELTFSNNLNWPFNKVLLNKKKSPTKKRLLRLNPFNKIRVVNLQTAANILF